MVRKRIYQDVPGNMHIPVSGELSVKPINYDDTQ
jgi:hypothetical protein